MEPLDLPLLVPHYIMAPVSWICMTLLTVESTWRRILMIAVGLVLIKGVNAWMEYLTGGAYKP